MPSQSGGSGRDYSLSRMHSGQASHLACCYIRLLARKLYLSQMTKAINVMSTITFAIDRDVDQKCTDKKKPLMHFRCCTFGNLVSLLRVPRSCGFLTNQFLHKLCRGENGVRIGRAVDFVGGVHGFCRHSRRCIAYQRHMIAQFGRITR